MIKVRLLAWKLCTEKLVLGGGRAPGLSEPQGLPEKNAGGGREISNGKQM